MVRPDISLLPKGALDIYGSVEYVDHTYSLETWPNGLRQQRRWLPIFGRFPTGTGSNGAECSSVKFPLDTAEVRGAMMTWEQAREMQRGGVHFGAHTMTHPVVSRLQPDGLDREIGESKRSDRTKA